MLIVGAGNLAMDLLSSFIEDEINPLVFYDLFGNDDADFFGYKRISNELEAKEYIQKYPEFIVALGNPIERRKWVAKVEEWKGVNVNFISSNTLITPIAPIAKKGVIIMNWCFVSVNSIVEEGVVIYLSTNLGHGSIIGAYTFISSQVCMSNTIIGENCFIGIGVKFKPGVTIGDNVIVGTGAVVTKNFPSNCVIAGVPAKILKYL